MLGNVLGSGGQEAARLFVRVTADTKAAELGLAKMNTQTQGFGNGLRNVGRRATSDLATIAMGAIAVKGAFDGTVGAAVEWESSFAGVRKTVDGTAKELSQLEGELLGMARTMPIAATELAAIAENAGALGIARQDIAGFTEVVAQLAATTDVSSDQASTALGQLSNVLKLTKDDYDNFGAALVDLGNKGASTESQILTIASRAGAGAALIGVASDATLGWASAVANLGIEAEAGGSSIQKFFLEMQKHVAAGGDELEAIAETAGMTAAEFKQAFEQDASAALATFIGGMGELQDAERLALLELLGFNDIRITRTLLGLAGNTDNLTDSLEIAGDAWRENTALTEEYGKRADTTASKVQVLGNRLWDLGRQIGESAPTDVVLGLADASVTGWERAFAFLEIRFGENAHVIDEWAQETGGAVWIVQGRMEELMATGLDFDTAFRMATSSWTPQLEEAGAAWESFQHTIELTPHVVEEATKSANPVTAYRESIEGIDEETRKELEEAREAAVAGMQNVVDGMVDTLADDPDAIKDAMQELLDRAADPYTDFQRRTDIEAQLAADSWRTILSSEDSGLIADAVWRAEQVIDQYELVAPGALAAGRLVNPEMQAGMDENLDSLITWIETNVTGEALTSLTLDEAEQIGLDGIWAYAQGMKAQEANAVTQAGIIASRAVNVLDDPVGTAWSGGYSILSSWIGGMASYFNSQGLSTLGYFVGISAKMLGGSLPEIGPLAGTRAEDGGTSIGEAWIGGMADSIDAGTRELGGPLGRVGSLLGANLGPDVSMATAAATAASSGIGGVGAGGIVINIENFNGSDGDIDRLADRLAMRLRLQGV